jgi:hypothetical protein
VENALNYVRAPAFDPAAMDFYPLPGKCQGPAIDLSLFQTDNDYTLDFNGTIKTSLKSAVVFRGAYAGEGDNPRGWKLLNNVKPPRPPAPKAVPVLVWMSPVSGQIGNAVHVIITGANFQPGATVAFSDSGVSATDVTVASPTEIRATLRIASHAVPGVREVVIRSPSGTSNTSRFQVKATAH